MRRPLPADPSSGCEKARRPFVSFGVRYSTWVLVYDRNTFLDCVQSWAGCVTAQPQAGPNQEEGDGDGVTFALTAVRLSVARGLH